MYWKTRPGGGVQNVTCFYYQISQYDEPQWIRKLRYDQVIATIVFYTAEHYLNPWLENMGYDHVWWYLHKYISQATGLDAWASRVKCPARFVSHLHEICIYIWLVYSLCFFCCLFIIVTWWYVWCIEWASGNQEEVQACLVTFWLFIISCYHLYKTTLGLLCSWFENNPHFHKYSMDFHV